MNEINNEIKQDDQSSPHPPYRGGDRGGSIYKSLYQACQTDWLAFDGSWRAIDDGRPVILHESISVFGQEMVMRFVGFTRSPILTYIPGLHGYKNFQYVPIPYDFANIAPLTHPDPWNRPCQASYVFGRKWLTNHTEGKVYGVKWKNIDAYRHELSKNAAVVCPEIDDLLTSKLANAYSYRFGIACENAICPGYITEKLFDLLIADTVPIYFGAELPEPLEECVVRANLSDLETTIRSIDQTSYLNKIKKIRSLRANGFLHAYSYEAFRERVLLLFDLPRG